MSIIETALNQMAQAYAEHANATSDRDDVVGSAVDTFLGITEEMSAKAAREIRAEKKAEIKNLKKLAKAMAKGETEEAKEEAAGMLTLIETL